jgi:hypothetical protein
MAYSILITNVDDHLHNHGFLHAERGLWRLAPAFDLNPFPDRARELKTWVSADTGPEATIDALMSVVAYFRLPRPARRKSCARSNGPLRAGARPGGRWECRIATWKITAMRSSIPSGRQLNDAPLDRDKRSGLNVSTMG